MNTDRDFDWIATAWLADGPDELSDRVLDAVADQIHLTRQRHATRVPWRFPTMTIPARFAAAAVIGVLAVGGAFLIFGRPGDSAVGGPKPSPTPSPVASPSAGGVVIAALTETYTSARYGLTLSYPAGWTTTPSTASWSHGNTIGWGDPALDTIRTDDVRLVVASQTLDPGETPAAWYQVNCQTDTPADECAAAIAGGWEKVNIDDATGYLNANGGLPPFTGVAENGQIFGAAVVSGGRGYQFILDGHIDRAMFDAFLATVRFPVIPILDTTYTSALGGYSIKYPRDWTVRPATEPWTAGYETMAYSDQIGIVTSIYGTSMKLPAGTSFDTWFAAYDADRVLGTACGTPSRNEDVTVDGVVGKLDVHCPANYVEAVIPDGGRVYVLTMFQPFSRPLFESFLGTVRLTPQTATR